MTESEIIAEINRISTAAKGLEQDSPKKLTLDAEMKVAKGNLYAFRNPPPPTPPPLTWEQERQRAYATSIDPYFIEAYMESIEKTPRPNKLDALTVKRASIKTKYPKPV